MSKKRFKDSPALAFIKPQEDIHEQIQENTHDDKQYNAQQFAHDNIQQETQYNTQQYAQYNAQEVMQNRKGYIRTQGRKGFKKPRINLAFDSEKFLDEIRRRAEYEGKSVTQFVNDSIDYYLKKTKAKYIKEVQNIE